VPSTGFQPATRPAERRAFFDLLRQNVAVDTTVDDHETRLDNLEDEPNWIYVDQTIGAPLFTNSWVNFDTEFSERNVAFCIHHGFVYLKGDASGGSVNASIFTLPAGYRPIGNRWFCVAANSVSAMLRIGSDGTVTIPVGGSNVFVDLGPVRFHPDQ
jgi:hypothetical protein